jgi:predicted ATPase/DNA-binding CsgD family transcriptional regulator
MIFPVDEACPCSPSLEENVRVTVGAASVSVTHFPVRRTSFVGRVSELQHVAHQLNRHRLVSLVGPGGSGKTRLALEAARAHAAGQGWFVDLAPTQPGEVGSTIAVAIEALQAPGESPIAAALRWIGDLQALLMLDNCDQVISACAEAVDTLLRQCPGLIVLATSREPLGVEGELVWRVPALSLPSDEEEVDGDAVLLFLDRAALAADEAVRDAAAIREICQRLDGMPLAIELAAARAAALPVPDILDALSNRLLSDGPRGGDSRQRSVAESIEWSYRLLDDDERLVLQRLSVFRSPFTTEAARVVASGTDLSEVDVLALLANLVTKSFVAVDERAAVTRYRLLETIREYAGQQLEERPEQARLAKDRHLRYFRTSAEYVEQRLFGDAHRRMTSRFEAELPDIRAAVSWAAATGDADEARRLVGRLWWFWWSRARSDSRAIIETALGISGGEPQWRALALGSLSQAALASFELDGLGLTQEAARLAEIADDAAVTARVLYWAGTRNVFMDPPLARSQLLRSCELARAVGDHFCLADSMTSLPFADMRDFAEGRREAEEAVTFAVDHDLDASAGHGRLSLVCVGLMQGGNLHQSSGVATAALKDFEQTGNLPSVALLHWHCVWLAALRADEETAALHAKAVRDNATASGNPLLQGIASFAEGLYAFAGADLDWTTAKLGEGLPVVSLFFAGGPLMPRFIEVLAESALRAGDAETARKHVACMREWMGELIGGSSADWRESRAAIMEARLRVHDGQIQEATDSVQRALELAQRNDDRLTMIDALEILAGLEAQRRSPELSARLLGAAAAERARIGYVRFRVQMSEHKSLITALKDQLGEDDFAKSHSEGEHLPLCDAVEMARRGRGSRQRPATGWDALTPAERRVVQLVGEGLSNAQIAERLFVSVPTVKTHVSSAFTKLDVTNRAELAVLAVRRTSI